MQVNPNPMGRPKIAPANRLRKTEPGMANVCLKRYAELNRSTTWGVWFFCIEIKIDAYVWSSSRLDGNR